MGFDAAARRALDRLRETWGSEGHDVQFVLLGVGDPADFAGRNAVAGQCLPLATAREWVSLTAFVPTRHMKRRKNGEPKLDGRGLAIGSPEHDLRRLLKESGLPEPLRVDSVPYLQLEGRRLHWLQFQRTRRSGIGRRAGERGYGFRLTFESDVQGPIALGYGAHFGLGLFAPSLNSG
jgi:CRISPR-associated protein Csb2